MQTPRIVLADGEALHILGHQGLVELLQLAMESVVATEMYPLPLPVDNCAGQALQVLHVHAFDPVPHGHLRPRRHVFEALENTIRKALRIVMRKASHQSGSGGKDRALQFWFHA
jgi:hypothetical protein